MQTYFTLTAQLIVTRITAYPAVDDTTQGSADSGANVEYVIVTIPAEEVEDKGERQP